MMFRAYMIHYRDRGGDIQRRRMVGLSREAVTRRVEMFNGTGCVISVRIAGPESNIRPTTRERLGTPL